ncbi:hypothetical protein QT381_02570 [Galbitalea sp. SE-J8]|uniref:hypothetical protein n=1 Tax=Galbitalea sp. SE-J8 TaxID=3054952 RepID=UPI00259D1A5D|nr:hypothetical protein [Galbitalea sp. SE-J8]MDM4761887.1 hypothetical protein [Galbitalea sp. SE-J8]
MAVVDGIITLDDARKSLGWAATSTADDADLETYIEAVTPVVERIVGPVIRRSKTYTVDGGRDVVLLPDAFSTLSTVTVGGVPLAGCVADPDAGMVYAPEGTVFAGGRRSVVIVVTVGYEQSDIPENIVLAAREIVRHLWQVGRQGTRPKWGTEEAEGLVPSYFALPKRAEQLLAPHARAGGFA